MWKLIKWDEVVTGVVYTVIAASILGVFRLAWQKWSKMPGASEPPPAIATSPSSDTKRISLTEALGKTSATFLAIMFQLILSAMLSDIHNAHPDISTGQIFVIWAFWLVIPVGVVFYRVEVLHDERKRSCPNAGVRFWVAILLHLAILELGMSMILK